MELPPNLGPVPMADSATRDTSASPHPNRGGRSLGYRVRQTWVPILANQAHTSLKCPHEPQFPHSEEDNGA